MLTEIISIVVGGSLAAVAVYSLTSAASRDRRQMDEFHDAMQRNRLRVAMSRVTPAPEDAAPVYNTMESVCALCNRVVGGPGIIEGIPFEQCPVVRVDSGPCLKWRSTVTVWEWQRATEDAAKARAALDFAKPLAGTEGPETVVFAPKLPGNGH